MNAPRADSLREVRHERKMTDRASETDVVDENLTDEFGLKSSDSHTYPCEGRKQKEPSQNRAREDEKGGNAQGGQCPTGTARNKGPSIGESRPVRLPNGTQKTPSQTVGQLLQ